MLLDQVECKKKEKETNKISSSLFKKRDNLMIKINKSSQKYRDPEHCAQALTDPVFTQWLFVLF